MRRLAALVLLAAVAHAQPPIDAPSPATRDGRPAPALDYFRFLNQQFDAEVYVDALQDILLFPPPGLEMHGYDDGEPDGAYYVRTTDGQVVMRHDLGGFLETGSEAFLRFRTLSHPESAGPLAPGDYLLDFVLLGDVVGRLPFSVRVEESGDPFDPGTTTVYSGPWERLGVFEQEIDAPDEPLRFTTWIRPDEAGEAAPRNVPGTTFTLLHEGTPVAASQHYRPSDKMERGAWWMVSDHLVPYDERERATLAEFHVSDLAPGRYTLEVRRHGDGGLIRTFAFEAGDGTIVPHPRSAMDYEPRYEYLTPRRMAGTNYDEPTDAFWVEAE
jgi:hypothetical protein